MTWRWLESTRELQEKVYGYVFHSSAPVSHGLTDYIDWNQTAAVQELAELREEFSWKPWATDDPFVNRDRMIDEIVDVNHFLGNILVALHCTDQEYEERYNIKQEINRRRAASGSYSAKKGGLSEGSDNDS